MKKEKPVVYPYLPNSAPAVQQTVAAFGGLDILFNNAGIIRRTTVLDISEDEWDRVMAVNVKSIFLLSSTPSPTWQHRQYSFRLGAGGRWACFPGLFSSGKQDADQR